VFAPLVGGHGPAYLILLVSVGSIAEGFRPVLDTSHGKLAVNEDEAQIVIDIYRRYLKLKSVHALRDELSGAGIKSKRRLRPNGAEYGGQKLSRGALYLMLQNRLYRGEIFHKGNIYPGERAAIIDETLWDEVQAVLVANRVERTTGARGRHPSLLTGMVFDEAGERLSPIHAVISPVLTLSGMGAPSLNRA
jgi:site-specific DNA recombinase